MNCLTTRRVQNKRKHLAKCNRHSKDLNLPVPSTLRPESQPLGQAAPFTCCATTGTAAGSLHAACDPAKVHGRLTSSSLGKGSLAANSSRRALRYPWSTFRFISWISTLKYLSSTKSTSQNTLKKLIWHTCLVQNQTNQKKSTCYARSTSNLTGHFHRHLFYLNLCVNVHLKQSQEQSGLVPCVFT